MYILMIMFLVGGLLYTNVCRKLNKGVEHVAVSTCRNLAPLLHKDIILFFHVGFEFLTSKGNKKICSTFIYEPFYEFAIDSSGLC